MVSNQNTENEPDRPEEPGEESEATSPEAIERRLKKNIVISIAIFILLAALFGTRRFALGVSAGGALAYLNYRWLHGSLKTILATAAAGKAPPKGYLSIAKFVLRWIVILIVLAVSAWKGGSEFVTGVTVGLFAFAGAAMIEAMVQAYYLIRGKSDS
jgi:hypothetical protein